MTVRTDGKTGIGQQAVNYHDVTSPCCMWAVHWAALVK